jgi:hypothetical protein
VQASGIAIGNLSSVFVVASFNNLDGVFLYKYSSNGATVWDGINPAPRLGPDAVGGVSVNPGDQAILAGGFAFLGPNNAYGGFAYGTYKADKGGIWLWTNLYPIGPFPPSAAQSLVVDSRDNVYVTGFSPTESTSNDIVTIAYDTNGKQLWLERYDGAAHGDDEGNAIAVDNNGNVYVAGYETMAGGGTEMVLIKYSPVTVKPQANGNILLQAQGAANEPFDIQASANFASWTDLGTNDADTNGLLQFLDTNAPMFPWRFYLALPQ